MPRPPIIPKVPNQSQTHPQRWVVPLFDDNDSDRPPITVEIRLGPHGIEIFAKGYGSKTMMKNAGAVVWLEHYNSKLRIDMWADINNEDPTFSGHFENAREALRKKE